MLGLLLKVLSADSRRCVSKCRLVRLSPLRLVYTQSHSWLLDSVLLLSVSAGESRSVGSFRLVIGG